MTPDRRASATSLLALILITAAITSGCGGGGISETIKSAPGPAQPAAQQMICNGAAALCARRYNEVSFPATHNSMSNLEESWGFPNQAYGIARQLNDGIRGLYLDIHYYDSQVYLCHGNCNIGRESLSSGLMKIKTFMDANPSEVVTIVFESYVAPADAAAVFVDTGLSAYAHAQTLNAEWPALRDMINSGKRLVVFSSGDADPAYPWYHKEWDYTWSSPYSFKKTSEFNCGEDRGSKDNAIFEVPHFITDGLPSSVRSQEANSNPLLIDRLRDCMAKTGRLPNIVSVDYYNLGDIFDAVKTLNGL